MKIGNTFVKTMFDKIYDRPVFERPMSPSKWVGSPTYLDITRLLMSCGGGMGGSRWYEYVERIDLDEIAARNRSHISVRTWDGRKLLINKSFIVNAEQLKIAFADLDSSNPHYPKGVYTYCLLLEDWHSIELVDTCRPTV